MIKIKILEYTENGNRVIVSVLYDDNTFTALNMLNTGNRDEILKDVYIISKDARNRQPFEGEVPKDLETYHKPQSSPSFLRNVDFYNLTGEVYDQFGQLMDLQPTFIIEGENARIEDNKIIEDVVDEDTSYFIVAKVGELEERQERFIYAPREEVPQDSNTEELQKQINDLQTALNILAGIETIEVVEEK